MIANNLHEACAVFRIIKRTFEKSFRETLNRGERSFEFVRDVCDKIAAHSLKAPQFTDVMQHHHRA